MSHPFRQSHLRLVAPVRPAGKRTEPVALAGPVLIVVMVIVGALALAEDPHESARTAWAKALEISGLSGVLAPPRAPAPRATYGICGFAPHRNCVIDGDTFYLGTEPVRIADIDAPETHPSRCAEEAQIGERATRRLRELLNAGPIALRPYDERDRDIYGRKLRIVERNGRSIGRVLVSEGLARPWGGRKLPWCG